MIKTRNIFAISLIAVMSVGIAKAEVVSTELLDKRLGTDGNLATVAATGAYADLTGAPTIPAAANNATLTIQKNSTSVGTFTANASADKTINITVPTKTSELTNDSSFATTTQVNAKVSTAQGTANAGKGLVVNSTGNLELQDIATQTELDAVNTTATNAASAAAAAQTAADSAQTTANKAVVANAAITAGTGTKITYDAKGLVTGSTTLAASDIPTLTTAKISGLDTTLAAKEDTANKVTVTEGLNAAGVGDSTTKFPSMATTNQMIDNKMAAITASVTKEEEAREDADAALQTAVDGKQAKSTAAYQVGNASGGWTALTAAEQNALKSGATTTNIAQITTNKNNIATNTTNIATNAANIATKQDILTTGTGGNLLAGSNVQISKDATSGAITISATDTKVTVDSALSSTSTNPVQNKVINTALAGKLDTTGTAAKATADASGNTITTTYATKAEIQALDATATGTGNVITSVSQTDGKITATKGNVEIPIGSATGTTYATIWVE